MFLRLGFDVAGLIVIGFKMLPCRVLWTKCEVERHASGKAVMFLYP